MSNNTPTGVDGVKILSAGEAERLASHLGEVVGALVDLVQHETELVRAGRLTAATRLCDRKADLTRTYLGWALQLRASQPHLSHVMSAEQLAQLRERHDEFRSLLQTNLTVLATAHAVSEGIVRGVSGEMARKAAPQTYGPSGRALAPPPSAAQPIAVSRVL